MSMCALEGVRGSGAGGKTCMPACLHACMPACLHAWGAGRGKRIGATAQGTGGTGQVAGDRWLLKFPWRPGAGDTGYELEVKGLTG